MPKKLKIVLLGEGKVGKTSILTQYVYSKFEDQKDRTVNASCLEKKTRIDNKDAVLCIWDTAGQEIFAALASMYYRDADGKFLIHLKNFSLKVNFSY